MGHGLPYKRFLILLSFVALLVTTISASCLLAQDMEQPAAENSVHWTRFHGPNGSGVVPESNLPVDVSDANYRWKIKLAGHGSSSPVIWGGQVFVSSSDPQTARLTMQCFDATNGKQKWETSFDSTPYRFHSLNQYASSTPAVDSRHVYFTYASPEHTMLVALDHQGNKQWERDFGTWRSQHGFGLSPIVIQDKVVLVNSQLAKPRDGATGGSRVIAVRCEDGKDAWEAPLTATRTCYSLPSLYRGADGTDQLICYNTGDGFYSLDPATGEFNWKMSSSPFRMRAIASTLIVDDLVIGSNGSGGGGNYLVAMKLSRETDQPPQPVFQVQRANYVPSPIAVDGMLFFFSDKGIGQCIDLKTGKRLWQERLAKRFSGSPVSDSKNIYLTDDSGKLFVIAAAAEYKLMSQHSLDEKTRSTPAISGDRLFIRTDTHLICVGNSK